MKVNCNLTLSSLDFKNHSIVEYCDELTELFKNIFELYQTYLGGNRYVKIIQHFGDAKFHNISQIQNNKYVGSLSMLNMVKYDDTDLQITFQNLSMPISNKLGKPTIIIEPLFFEEMAYIIPMWVNIFLQNYNEFMQKKQDYTEETNKNLKNLGFTGALFKQ